MQNVIEKGMAINHCKQPKAVIVLYTDGTFEMYDGEPMMLQAAENIIRDTDMNDDWKE